MIRINRLIKKASIFKVLHLPHVAKVTLQRGKANQKDPNRVRVYIYLTTTNSDLNGKVFKNVMASLLNHKDLKDSDYSTLRTAIRDGFIKESTYNKLGIPTNTYYNKLCDKYNQEFFENFE